MSSETIAKKNLSELDFRRWRLLMNRIDKFEERRRELQEHLVRLNKESKGIYQEMEKLWTHSRKSPP